MSVTTATAAANIAADGIAAADDESDSGDGVAARLNQQHNTAADNFTDAGNFKYRLKNHIGFLKPLPVEAHRILTRADSLFFSIDRCASARYRLLSEYIFNIVRHYKHCLSKVIKIIRASNAAQKPLRRIKRIVRRVHLNSADTMARMNFFAGSVAVGKSAQKLQRQYLLTDKNPYAIKIIQPQLSLK